MKLYKTGKGILLKTGQSFYLLNEDWDELVNRADLAAFLKLQISQQISIDESSRLLNEELLPPIGLQDFWAAGVTY